MIMHFYVRPYRSKFMDRLDDILLVFMLSIFIACAHFKLEQDTRDTVDGSGMNESDIDNFSYFVLGTMAASACFLAFFVGKEVLSSPAFSPLAAASFAQRFSTGLTI